MWQSRRACALGAARHAWCLLQPSVKPRLPRSVLDARSGTVLRTIPVGRTPTGIVPLTDHRLTATTGDTHNMYIGSV